MAGGCEGMYFAFFLESRVQKAYQDTLKARRAPPARKEGSHFVIVLPRIKNHVKLLH